MTTDNALEIDKEARWVVWRVAQSLPGRRLQTPWGELWRGAESGAGLEVWIEARESFGLVIDNGPTRYFETITPGRHRFILTTLDSTDVA
jgi:hypothetical protein